ASPQGEEGVLCDLLRLVAVARHQAERPIEAVVLRGEELLERQRDPLTHRLHELHGPWSPLTADSLPRDVDTGGHASGSSSLRGRRRLAGEDADRAASVDRDPALAGAWPRTAGRRARR